MNIIISVAALVVSVAAIGIAIHNMKAITDYVAAQSLLNGRIDTAVQNLQADVGELGHEIENLKKQIDDGTLTDEDKAALQGLLDRQTSIADKLDALDAMTPPAAPDVPVPTPEPTPEPTPVAVEPDPTVPAVDTPSP